MPSTTFNIEERFNEFASASASAEASAFPTVETNPYRLQVTKYEGKEFNDHPYAHLTVSVQNEDGSRKLATVFADITWVEKRYPDGKLIKEFKLYDQLTRALYPDLTVEQRTQKDLGQVLADATAYPVSGFVTEKFQTIDAEGKKKWVSPKTADEKVGYRSKGFKAGNFIANFSQLR